MNRFVTDAEATKWIETDAFPSFQDRLIDTRTALVSALKAVLDDERCNIDSELYEQARAILDEVRGKP